jgi:hypothetical protein
MNPELFTFEYSYNDLMFCVRDAGIKLFDPNIYFNHPIVKHNYGIESCVYDSSNSNFTRKVIFIINDRKKFLLKMIKYGIV